MSWSITASLLASCSVATPNLAAELPNGTLWASLYYAASQPAGKNGSQPARLTVLWKISLLAINLPGLDNGTVLQGKPMQSTSV
ncbi:hypothetical protein KSX_53900 [Ktedonospora formicarum]|uniref:Uncharacterized protein n=1 Tax=Ktedonospora formicarum TaxID=2778364 RepID=A0A8J3I716_9CHLR|nr:hypothetical protein KSX_53900 [Ktedonospora formicarum]